MPLRTILVIDDTPDHCAIVGRLLRAVGYRVVEASPGVEALNTACGLRPDLILTTLSMPGQPAWETARLLADAPALANTPILGATLYTTLLPWPRMRAIGCADFVAKPFDIDELLRRITALLPTSPQPALAA